MRICLFKDRHVDNLEPLASDPAGLRVALRPFPTGGQTVALLRRFGPGRAGTTAPRRLAATAAAKRGRQRSATGCVARPGRAGQRPLAAAARRHRLTTSVGRAWPRSATTIAYARARSANTARRTAAPRRWTSALHGLAGTPCRSAAAGGRAARLPRELVDLNAARPVRGLRAQREFLAGGRRLPGGSWRWCGAQQGRGSSIRRRHLEPMAVADTTGRPGGRGARRRWWRRSRGWKGRATSGRKLSGPRARRSSRRHQRWGRTAASAARSRPASSRATRNKYHDGFLGHSYVGEWVNLGAGTHNSDLRNDYGDVSVVVHGRRARHWPGEGRLLPRRPHQDGAGRAAQHRHQCRPFCNLLPSGGLLPKYVPSFGGLRNGVLVENADLSALLLTAQGDEPAGAELTEAHESCIEHCCRRQRWNASGHCGRGAPAPQRLTPGRPRNRPISTTTPCWSYACEKHSRKVGTSRRRSQTSAAATNRGPHPSARVPPGSAQNPGADAPARQKVIDPALG